ncbi:hypothetical protein BDF14DRAFT_1695153, partial [Spinellus fusiger]
LSSFHLKVFNNTIISKGSCYKDIIGFIDITIDTICIPDEHQESVITVSLCGPFVSVVHDQNMLDTSAILNEIVEQLNCCETDGNMYDMYDNSAYSESEVIIRPFVAIRIAKEQRVN